jgi:hypothetical protein
LQQSKSVRGARRIARVALEQTHGIAHGRKAVLQVVHHLAQLRAVSLVPLVPIPCGSIPQQ